jgi:hypothetical protein
VTRDEHLALCKKRALESVEAGDFANAVSNMASDLRKRPDTDNPALGGLERIGILYVADADKAAVPRWIEGFR